MNKFQVYQDLYTLRMKFHHILCNIGIVLPQCITFFAEKYTITFDNTYTIQKIGFAQTIISRGFLLINCYNKKVTSSLSFFNNATLHQRHHNVNLSFSICPSRTYHFQRTLVLSSWDFKGFHLPLTYCRCCLNEGVIVTTFS